MSAQHTPGPWDCVNATEHHGFYVVSPWGGTVCDLYAMSNPSAASIRNGGNSFPIAHQEGCDEANARLIAAAPDLAEALQWYAEQVLGCRKIGSAGDPFRQALDRDGGERARAALGKVTAA